MIENREAIERRVAPWLLPNALGVVAASTSLRSRNVEQPPVEVEVPHGSPGNSRWLAQGKGMR